MENSRRTAAFIVARWIATREFPSSMLPDGKNRAFVQDLVYTVIRRMRPLRKVLGELILCWPRGELEALLYVGAAQLLYHKEVPDYAAVNETVAAAKLCTNPSIAKVVNGVMHNLIRRRKEFVRMIDESPIEERESFPTELVHRWQARFGDEDTLQLCRWFNKPAATFLARKDGSFVVLDRGRKVSEVEGYKEGEFIVQDRGTALAVELMNVHPGVRVLDACAAPGGKTIQLAWRGAKVIACEVNPKRRQVLQENLRRVKLADQVTVVPSLDDPAVVSGGFSRILVDAPCSNTGVLRRRPDARWNWNPDKLGSLTKLQAEILDQTAKLLAPGGELIYSTCSIEKEENMDQVSAFISRHPDFTLKTVKESLPHLTSYDGAFAASLVR